MSGELPKTISDGESARRRAYQRAWRAANPERVVDYRAKNAQRQAELYRNDPEYRAKQIILVKSYQKTKEAKAVRAAWRKENAEKINLQNRIWALKPENKAREAIRAADPKVKQAISARRNSRERRAASNLWQLLRYRTIPSENLRRRMSRAVRGCLKNGTPSANKTVSPWLRIVGYTIDDLRAHIERQFLPKMGWHNMPEWHIDHIIPLSSFNIQTKGDSEFKAAWAITNLRPLWGADNIRKGSKRVVLL